MPHYAIYLHINIVNAHYYVLEFGVNLSHSFLFFVLIEASLFDDLMIYYLITVVRIDGNGIFIFVCSLAC